MLMSQATNTRKCNCFQEVLGPVSLFSQSRRLIGRELSLLLLLLLLLTLWRWSLWCTVSLFLLLLPRLLSLLPLLLRPLCWSRFCLILRLLIRLRYPDFLASFASRSISVVSSARISAVSSVQIPVVSSVRISVVSSARISAVSSVRISSRSAAFNFSVLLTHIPSIALSITESKALSASVLWSLLEEVAILLRCFFSCYWAVIVIVVGIGM
jgi:hypothetical protein